MTVSLSINDQAVAVDADPSTQLLWVLRDHLGMTGTKFGCGIAQCGACRATELEGGTLFGLNMSLNEELNIKDGRIVEGNYDQYPMIRMTDVPRSLHVHFGGLSNNPRFNEIGEPPVGSIGPAIGNAIFQGTGKRVRTTTLRKHDLSWT
jgi:hypothetical protein